MQLPRFPLPSRAAIIGALVLLVLPWLGGCSSLRLGYGNGAQLAWWWLDGYVDFSREQSPAAKQAIERWFAWHRATQLGDYSALLAAAALQIQEPATPALACRWNERLREAAEPALERAIAEFADLLPGLGEAQFRHIEQRFAKTIDEMRDDYLQADPAQRRKASVKRVLERAERLYGSLDEQQLRVVHAGVAASPFNPEMWMVERRRRQLETVQSLRRLVAERADRDARIAALRALLVRAERSPDPEYRAYQLRLTEYNCAYAAQIHNATTPAQRLKARETIRAWEEDVRSFAAVPG